MECSVLSSSLCLKTRSLFLQLSFTAESGKDLLSLCSCLSIKFRYLSKGTLYKLFVLAAWTTILGYF